MLSILIPTYNYNVNPLVKDLHDMAVLENIAFEIIVLDDASPNTFSSETTLENVTYLKNEKNLGRTLTRKKLAETALYENILFLDADVIPVNNDFIAKYVLEMKKDFQVVLGGYAYEKTKPERKNILRYKYGKEREEMYASIRNLNPYGFIFSGNILIKKRIFLENNYSDALNLYGMDIFFAYKLYTNNVKVNHIDNPIYHLGLEANEVFFKKCLESVVSRKQFLENEQGIEKVNGLLRHYKKLKKYRLTGLVSIGFKLTGPFLKKMIFKKDPSLFCLDIYRLGYICAIK